MTAKKISLPSHGLNLKNEKEIESHLVRQVSDIIMHLTGVQLGEKQSHMVSSRLHRRLQTLRLSSAEYIEYFNRNQTSETQELVSLITTHHTFFFREFFQFEFLRDTGLRFLIEAAKKRGQRELRFWSAACSRGHEVYSLAMFLNVHLKQIDPSFTYSILGTDVDPQSVEIAKNGVYHHKDIETAPAVYIDGHWARGTGDISQYVKARQPLRANCSFRVENLLNIQALSDGKKFDAVFCRNVFIYFNSAQIEAITAKLVQSLHPEGYLFLGISETLNPATHKLVGLGQSTYQPAGAASAKPSVSATVIPIKQSSVPQSAAKPLRVLCVDDSQTVHTLLSQILTKDSGFEIVGQAKNGKEAAELRGKTNPDIMTLDIHMPEQNGIEYLERNFGKDHPPVVMISSVSREDANMALRALRLGAADYVEKPNISHFKDQADQIRTKLKCAFASHNAHAGRLTEVDVAFQKHPSISQPDQVFRLILASPGDRKKLQSFLKELSGEQPPTVIFFQRAESILAEFAADMSVLSGRKVHVLAAGQTNLLRNQIYIGDFETNFSPLKSHMSKRKCSACVFGRVSDIMMAGLRDWRPGQILLEDLGGLLPSSAHLPSSDTVPVTSFAYMSSDFLGR